MGRPTRHPPRWYAPDPDDWLASPLDDGPAERARLIAATLAAAVEGRSLREVDRDIGVDRLTIRKILDGAVWPDIETVTKLELGLDVTLWPALPPDRTLSPKRPGSSQGNVDKR